MDCRIQYYENSGRAWCGIHDRDEASCLRVENARLRAELQEARACAEASDKRKEVWLFRFEEARKIIEEVSHSPEFKKFYWGNVEQDPCGVHAFTKKYAVSPPQNEVCPPEVCPLCYHRKDDPAHLSCETERPADGAPKIAHCGGLHCGYPMSRNCICLCDECATAKKADR